MSSLPLAGVTVLDLGQIYASPYAALLLAHLGARVIKVEPPTGEALRHRGTLGAQGGTSTNFQMLNAGKESVVLDLKTAAGRESLLDMVRWADVLLHNFAPGTAERLEIDYPSLRRVNPRLVYGAVAGYSSDSPHRDLKAMDLTIQAESAIMSVTGFPDQPPVKAGAALVDFAAGTNIALAVAAALYGRAQTGEGQELTVSLQDAVIPTLTSNIGGWIENDGALPERVGNSHGGLAQAPYNNYRTADGWIAILCLTEKHWQALCAAIGRPELITDLRYANAAQRVVNREAVDQEIESWTRLRTRDEVASVLRTSEVVAAPVRTLAELLASEAARASPMLERRIVDGRESTILGSPVRNPAGALTRLDPAPDLGAHTEAVLDETRRSVRSTDNT